MDMCWERDNYFCTEILQCHSAAWQYGCYGTSEAYQIRETFESYPNFIQKQKRIQHQYLQYMRQNKRKFLLKF